MRALLITLLLVSQQPVDMSTRVANLEQQVKVQAGEILDLQKRVDDLAAIVAKFTRGTKGVDVTKVP